MKRRQARRVVGVVVDELVENFALAFEELADFVAGFVAEVARLGGDLVGQFVDVGKLRLVVAEGVDLEQDGGPLRLAMGAVAA